MEKPNILIRPARQGDTSELCELLNEIIEVGGTTAIEIPLTEEEFQDYFLRGEGYICCHVAVHETGLLIGFQSLGYHTELPGDWADIATFARVNPKVSGVGTALFGASKMHAENAGIASINATIRADNAGGLGYYEKMGFRTCSVKAAVPLSDGTPVDRISKRFFVA